MLGSDHRPVESQGGRAIVAAPGPRVAEPRLGYDVDRCCVRPMVGDRDLHQHIGRTRLCIGDGHVEKPVVGEDPGVGELVLRVELATRSVAGQQIRIGEGGLRVAVEPGRERVRRRRIGRPPDLFDVFAVVALGVGQPEVALLEPVVVAVPQRDTEVEESEAVTEPRHTVLAPSIGASVRMVERQVVPGVSVLRVVLTDGAPLATGHVGPPQTPRCVGSGGCRESVVLGGGRGCGCGRHGIETATVTPTVAVRHLRIRREGSRSSGRGSRRPGQSTYAASSACRVGVTLACTWVPSAVCSVSSTSPSSCRLLSRSPRS